MAEPHVIVLKCPVCQSQDCAETGKGAYRCNTCRAKFVIQQESPRTVNHTTTIQTPPIDAKKILLGLLSGFCIIGLFVLLSIFFGRSKKPHVTYTPPLPKERGSVDYVIPVPNKKGVYLWKEVIYRKSETDLHYSVHMLEIYNPVTNEMVKQIPMTTSKKFFSLEDPFEYADGKCWVIVEGGLMAFDVNTFQEVETNQTLMKRHTELSSGILSCSFERHRVKPSRYMEIETKDGSHCYYLPQIDQIISSGEADKLSSSYAWKFTDSCVYLKKDEGRHDEFFYPQKTIRDIVFPVHKDGRAGFFFSELERGNKKQGLFKYMNTPMPRFIFSSYFMEGKSDRFVTDRVFFYPQVFYFDKDRLVISFRNDADEENSPRVIQCLSAETGDVLWTCAEEPVQKLESDYYLQAAVGGSDNNEVFVLCSKSSTLSEKRNRAVGLQMKTGKIVFEVPAEIR